MAETKEVSYDGLKDAAYSDSSTNAAQRRVKSALQYSLKNKYGIDDDGVTRNILKVHGLDESSFDVIARAEKCLRAQIRRCIWLEPYNIIEYFVIRFLKSKTARIYRMISSANPN